MVAIVDICNRALSHLGTQSQIQSLSENSAEALHCSIHYDPMRADLLRKYNWGFARKQVSLALLKAAQGTQENPSGTALPIPPVPWLYAYAKPADCFRERRILPIIPPLNSNPPIMGGMTVGTPMPMGPPVRFTPAVDTDKNGNDIPVILTNQQQAILIYTKSVADPNIFDALFQTALVGRLAAALVIPLSGDKALAKIAIADGEKAEIEAAAYDADEGLTVINQQAEWIRARGAAGAWAEYGGPGWGPLDGSGWRGEWGDW